MEIRRRALRTLPWKHRWKTGAYPGLLWEFEDDSLTSQHRLYLRFHPIPQHVDCGKSSALLEERIKQIPSGQSWIVGGLVYLNAILSARFDGIQLFIDFCGFESFYKHVSAQWLFWVGAGVSLVFGFLLANFFPSFLFIDRLSTWLLHGGSDGWPGTGRRSLRDQPWWRHRCQRQVFEKTAVTVISSSIASHECSDTNLLYLWLLFFRASLEIRFSSSYNCLISRISVNGTVQFRKVVLDSVSRKQWQKCVSKARISKTREVGGGPYLWNWSLATVILNSFYWRSERGKSGESSRVKSSNMGGRICTRMMDLSVFALEIEVIKRKRRRTRELKSGWGISCKVRGIISNQVSL